ncbi:hypothetical protein L4C33_20420 [Vibrio makurazakiensis]|uniref:hypothetical protein n=1 Tax=Vibrio makurazakiensis TaxID=2910250 RepID=UPI003D0E1E53
MRKSLLMALILLGALVGCYEKDELERLDVSHFIDGQTQLSEVKKELGSPIKIRDQQDEVYTYLYESDDYLVALTFHQGVLLFREKAKNDGRYDFKRVM